jgi:sulfotransferase family protein
MGEPRRVNPYVFLVGCLRSGTTLLQRIVDAHPEIAIIHETQWVPRWYERRVGLTQEGMVTSELVERLLAHRRFPRLELDPADVEALVDHGRPKHYSDFVSDVFDLHGRVKGKRLVGEKSPGYVRHLPALHELWPDARIVHLIRDGRDVALSVLEWKKRESTAGQFPTWEEDPITTAALWWEWHVRLGREAADLLGPERYCEFSYESLVADPERECAALCTFLGVTYDDAMLRFHEGRRRPKPGRSAKAAWLPVTRGLRSWREQMAATDVEHFEAVAGPLLDELGYARAGQPIGREELAQAARLRKVFADGVRGRRRRVPAAWTKDAA